MEVTNLRTSFITVTGAVSGPHSGVTHVASDGRTVVFTMPVDFSQNELVTVTLDPHLAGGAHGRLTLFEYQFMITAPMPGSPSTAVLSSTNPVPTEDTSDDGELSEGSIRGYSPNGGTLANWNATTPPGAGKRLSLTGEPVITAAVIMPNGISVPSDFPKVAVTINSNPSPGYLFLDTGNGIKPYTMILDNSGLPIWYRRGRMENFKTEQNNLITGYADAPIGGFQAFDRNFNYIQTLRTTNGYSTDKHELRVLADGSYLMLGVRLNTVDMSKYRSGGRTNAVVTEGVVQEFTAAGELIFQWRAWDNYDIRDGTADFPHFNAIDIDEDGHILVSARHLSETTKINRNTGEIIWRLSGRKSSFTFLNDPQNGTSYQHSISALGNGRYMVFDNGNNHNPQVSRAVEYQLNPTNRTATMVWQFRDTPQEFSGFMGNAQRLPNGNTLINWVYDKIVEVDPKGAKHFEIKLVGFNTIYRVYRFPWEGVVKVPYLIVEPYPDNTTLLFNKFGDTNVAYYRIYGGTTPRPTNLLATSSTTLRRLTKLENGRFYYFRVTAVDKGGEESSYSNEENVMVDILQPGQNMVANGDFALGTDPWTLALGSTATAALKLTNGAAYVDITNAGSALANIQLKQAGLRLMQGKQLVLEFDAWADAPRYLEARLLMNQSPSTTYKVFTPSLTPTKQHFSYPFTMSFATDLNTRLAFNLGASAIDVHLDKVSVRTVAPGDFNRDKMVNLDDLSVFASQWLKQGAGSTADLNTDGKVDFMDFQWVGENWSNLHQRDAGSRP